MPLRDAIIITLWALAAGAIAWVAVEVLRLLDRRRHREAESEPPPRRASLGVLLLVVRQALRRGPRVPEHVGATEAWSPKAETDAEHDDPGLITRQERLGDSLRTHDELAKLRAAEAAFSATLTAALAAFVRPLPAQTQLRLASAATDTGEISRAELDALLAQDLVSA